MSVPGWVGMGWEEGPWSDAGSSFPWCKHSGEGLGSYPVVLLAGKDGRAGWAPGVGRTGTPLLLLGGWGLPHAAWGLFTGRRC